MAIFRIRGRDSSDSIVSGYGRDGRTIEVRSPAEAKRIFPLASVSRLALRPTQPPIQWVPERGPFLGGKRDRGVTLTNPSHLLPRSWMSRSCISPSSCACHRCVVVLPYLHIQNKNDMSFIPFLSYLLCYNFDYPRVKEFECWSQW
jgi:hypothetical protein